ncbi:MAG: hypothetical protein KJZ98_13750, partial [Burkholderiaceae bacterium]|nr:hypothetical protein [Burkholderiaceae bacterium]
MDTLTPALMRLRTTWPYPASLRPCRPENDLLAFTRREDGEFAGDRPLVFDAHDSHRPEAYQSSLRPQLTTPFSPETLGGI